MFILLKVLWKFVSKPAADLIIVVLSHSSNSISQDFLIE